MRYPLLAAAILGCALTLAIVLGVGHTSRPTPTHRKLARDIAWVALRHGDLRLALAVLIWPPGWSHTRLEKHDAR